MLVLRFAAFEMKTDSSIEGRPNSVVLPAAMVRMDVNAWGCERWHC